ncbi:hypothetical protein D3C80_416910 [compost metagenome]
MATFLVGTHIAGGNLGALGLHRQQSLLGIPQVFAVTRHHQRHAGTIVLLNHSQCRHHITLCQMRTPR